ncbi:RadC family protein [Streptococcus dentiloxodontae]
MYTIQYDPVAILPRERLMQEGAEHLSNQELLAILLRTGTKQESVLNLANRILSDMDSLTDFSLLSLQELQQISGIGKVKSIELKAMLEFAKRIHKSEIAKSERIMSSKQMAHQMMIELGDERQEHVVAVYLDTQNRIIQKKTVFIGSVRRSIAEPREILHHACRLMATSLILIHNHPSGAVEPSSNDMEFTNKIKRSCDDLGICFLDHIIVGKFAYYSFREENRDF